MKNSNLIEVSALDISYGHFSDRQYQACRERIGEFFSEPMEWIFP